MTTLTGVRVGRGSEVTAITVRDGHITAIGDSPSGRVIDADGLTARPGLIDLQINGAYGHDFTADPGSIWRVGERLPAQGVTTFLPTIITSRPDVTEAAVACMAARPAGYRGAEPLGLHLEGPMLSPQRPGVHDTSLMRLPSATTMDGWSPDRGVRMVTLAPELDGAEQAVKTLVDAGVVVSAGHTAADYNEAVAGFGWGIRAVTHLFNAMEPFSHRAPGLIGAAFENPEVVAGMIVDGVHSHPATVRAAWKLLGPGRLALVTDAMAAAGMDDGRYEIGSVVVDVSGDRATDPQGRLAGSTLTLDLAVRNLIEFTGCDPDDALAAASAVPARLLDLGDRGRVEPGARADLVLFDDSMQVAATMIAGEVVWQS